VTLDNVPLAEFISPTLACVTRDPVTMGTLGAELVLELINGGAPRTVELPTTFVPGESCAAPLS
jgi:DNA-binding LacI/PurR family transcriptional regulator